MNSVGLCEGVSLEFPWLYSRFVEMKRHCK